MITQEQLKEQLHYDPRAGIFTRLKCFQRPDVVGKIKERNNGNGYARITILGRRYYAHRLAWFYMTGEWPSMEIDHRNGDRSDNRWDNLRDVAPLVNKQNKRSASVSSKSGILGVSWDAPRRAWVARIKVGMVYKYLGRFDDIEAARHAYLAAKRKFHEGCTI